MNAVPFAEALSVWWRIGVLSFGGPAGQIALMHRILVDEKRWVSEPRFLHALNYCMLLPGPEAQQLATYIGWLLHGVRGGIVAGVLFVLPGAAAILAFSLFYVFYGDVSAVEGLFFGLKAAVLAIVLQALIRIARRALDGTLKPLLAAGGFVALFAFGLPFPLVVLGAGAIGYTVARYRPDALSAERPHLPPGASADVLPAADRAAGDDDAARPGTRAAAVVCAVLWLAPLGALYLFAGPANVYTEIATFFSKMAMVTFGGAYAVLAYVAQQGVEHYQWLQSGEMLDGLGLAETTPGPLILVTQFVGFLAASRGAGWESVALAGTAGALLTTWVTFLPCFLWIFAGAPYVEKLRGHAALSAALAAVTAAVVGVIANLVLWFAVNTLFAERFRYQGFGMDLLVPVPESVRPALVALAVLAVVLVFVFKVRVVPLLATCASLGVLWVLV